MSKIILQKAFTREFPLLQVQMWGRRYSKEFLGESTFETPFYVFKVKDGLVEAYRNVSGHTDVINTIIKKKIENDPAFFDRLTAGKTKKFEDLVNFINKQSISHEEFIIFLDELFDNWQLHYIAQFVPLDEKRFDKKIRAQAIKLRETVDKVIIDCWQSIIPSLKKLYPELGDLVFYISWDEVKNFQIPSILELKKREFDGVLLYNGEIIDSEKLKVQEAEFGFSLEQEDFGFEEKVVFGQTAYSGIVKGKVRKILKEKDAPFLNAGDILVSYMAMPAFLIAMKKAVAFVTDEGGITCHAAIVAREMGKPCIIGTKIATRVLKDGDLVEVNADEGTVKIIKRAEN